MKSGKYMWDWFERIIVAGGAFCMGIVLAVVVIWGKRDGRLAHNGILMLIVVSAIMLIGVLYAFEKNEKKRLKNPLLWLILGYALLYMLQLLWVNRVYFYTGWDVQMMRLRVEGIVNGGSMADLSSDADYSTYPNNLLLFYVFCLIEKTGMLFSMKEPYLLCIYISCLCVNLSCFLGNLIMRRLTDSSVFRGCYMVLSTVFILFSPWIIIPYSDTFGMFFVMAGMWGLICLDGKFLKWAVTVFAAVIGYSIKPTCIFPLFAGCFMYGIRYLCDLRQRWKELCVLLGCVACAGCISLLIPIWIQHTYSFRLIPERNFTYMHYLMMGFNEETKGGYNPVDYDFSRSFPDVESREKAEKEELFRRLREMIEGKRLGSFLLTKALFNFNNGTFAWGDEGGFFLGYVEHDNILSDWFKEVVIPPGIWENEGKYYVLYRTVTQTIWLFILTGCVLSAAGGGVNIGGIRPAC